MRQFFQRRKTRKPRVQRSAESGYAYLFALFLVIMTIVVSTEAIQDFRTEGRRQREEEMIWRGNQFAKAISRYFHKTGKYPQTAEDLEKGLPELHFLRWTAYKDPMNKDDGSWRFIYINATGQIIGSVRYASLQQMALIDTLIQQGCPVPSFGDDSTDVHIGVDQLAAPPSLGGSNNSSCPSLQKGQGSQDSGQGGGTTANSPASSQSAAQPGQQNTPQGPQSGQGSMQSGQLGQPGQQGGLAMQNAQIMANAAILQQKPTGPVDGPVLGGFLIGVGSTVDQHSLKVYKGGQKYKQWEFIWNPVEEQAKAVQQGIGAGQGQMPLGGLLNGGLPVANPNGGSSTPAPSPQPTPGQPQQ